MSSKARNTSQQLKQEIRQMLRQLRTLQTQLLTEAAQTREASSSAFNVSMPPPTDIVVDNEQVLRELAVLREQMNHVMNMNLFLVSKQRK